MIKSKKGQFYIFLSLILLAYIAAIAPSFDTQKARESDYSYVKENFMVESSYVINNAIYEEKDVLEQLDSYVESFIEYGSVQGLDVSLIYFLKFDDSVYIKNYYKDVFISYSTNTVKFGKASEIVLDSIYEFSVNASDYEYYSVELESDKRIDFETIFKLESE